jgi:hypothetical protein
MSAQPAQCPPPLNPPRHAVRHRSRDVARTEGEPGARPMPFPSPRARGAASLVRRGGVRGGGLLSVFTPAAKLMQNGSLVSGRRIISTTVEGREQRRQMLLVMPPAPDRAPVDRLADLPMTDRCDGALGRRSGKLLTAAHRSRPPSIGVSHNRNFVRLMNDPGQGPGGSAARA